MIRSIGRRPAVTAELSLGTRSSTLILRRTGRRKTSVVWHETRLEWGMQTASGSLAGCWPDTPAHRVRRLTLVLPATRLQWIQLDAARHLRGLALERHLEAGLETHLGSSDGPWWFDFRLPDDSDRPRETTRQITVVAVRRAVVVPILRALADARLPLDAIHPAPEDAPQTAAGVREPDTDMLFARLSDGAL